MCQCEDRPACGCDEFDDFDHEDFEVTESDRDENGDDLELEDFVIEPGDEDEDFDEIEHDDPMAYED